MEATRLSFAPTPARAVQGIALAGGCVRRRLGVSAAQLQPLVPEADDLVLGLAVQRLLHLRVEALTAAQAAEIGVEPQTAFVAAAAQLLALAACPAVAQADADVAELQRTVDRLGGLWIGSAASALNRVDALAGQIAAARPALEAASVAAGKLNPLLEGLLMEATVATVIVRHLRTPTDPPVPTVAATALAGRDDSLGQKRASLAVAIAEVRLVAANLSDHLTLIGSAVLNAVPAWRVAMAGAGILERTTLARPFAATVRRSLVRLTPKGNP